MLREMFQFPSNGKARVNELFDGTNDIWVTHSFQFPSNGKARVNKDGCTTIVL